ncbi:hypothetical protein SDC9_137818 [bioreactor metagenome]|uniref:Uncharacterized protein n=1 Tax=bioreactor metagenome TaxID=1076179 RepID=A0A645DN32_9ZZZZ
MPVKRNGHRVAAAPVEPPPVRRGERPIGVIIRITADRNAVALFIFLRFARGGAEDVRFDIVKAHTQHAVPQGVFGSAPVVEGEAS